MKEHHKWWAAMMILGCTAGTVVSKGVTPVAVFSFEERGSGVKGYGGKVADILFASLVTDPDVYLVDRAEIDKVVQEQELNISGAVTPGQATKVGQLTGAKILVSGSVVEADNTLYVVAKIIGTETSRVLGESVKGRADDQIGPLVESLAQRVAITIKTRDAELLPPVSKPEDRVAKIKEALGDRKRPKLLVHVTERHVGQSTLDPAAETELIALAKAAGFDVIDRASGATADADITLEGEGFSEFALRRGNLVSVKARVELKAVDRSGNVVTTDRQTAVVVDLSEQIAGKSALQEAAAELAERVLPQLAK